MFAINDDRNRPWDASAALGRVQKWASSDGSGDKDKIDWKKYATAFFYTDLHSDANANGDDFEDFHMPFVDIVDDEPQAIWSGITAAAAAVQGSRGASIPSAVVKKVKAEIAHYYAEAKKKFKDDSIEAPWLRSLSVSDEFESRYGKFGGIETRVIPIDVRTSENGDPKAEFTVAGHAAVFNRASLDLGGFTETIEPGAFTAALVSNPDVVCNWDHDNRYVLGRTGNKTLRLNEDSQGLSYSVRVAPTSYAADLRILLERGDIDQASFAFTVDEDDWDIRDTDDGPIVTRSIKRIGQLFDVCVTAQGAYPQTNSQVARAYFLAEAEARIAQRAADPDVQYIPEPYTQEADEDIQCPCCGCMNSDDAVYCDQCGEMIAGQFIEEPGTEPDADDTQSSMVRVAHARAKARLYKLNQ